MPRKSNYFVIMGDYKSLDNNSKLNYPETLQNSLVDKNIYVWDNSK